jgi:alanine dehydrogenase
MTLLLRGEDVRASISFPRAVEVVGAGVTAAVSDPGVALGRSTIRFEGGWLRMMGGALPGSDIVGFKAFHMTPGGKVRYLCALYRMSSGEPLALVDANELTVVRTSAAAAAAAARYWGDERFALGVIGTGLQARDGLRALASVCGIDSVRVFSPRESSRRSFVHDLGEELALEVEAVDSAAAAAKGAGMVLCATQTQGAVAFRTEDADDHRYISSVSSTLPDQRELDERLIAAADVLVVDTLEALEESGDLLAAAKAGLHPERTALLGTYLEQPPKASALTVYKSIGRVEQDLVLAAEVWRHAVEQGRGEDVAPIELAKD